MQIGGNQSFSGTVHTHCKKILDKTFGYKDALYRQCCHDIAISSLYHVCKQLEESCT